jgi:catechol 2,3-dioxygenase-like lactoylglutathione lyase family enzyme
MRATGLNHVSIHARNLEESTRFYEEFFGLKRVPTPDFGHKTQWLQVGSAQLHLFEFAPEDAPRRHHLAFDVDDFEEFHAMAEKQQIQDKQIFDVDMRELPDGSVQMYIRDPADNLVEITYPDARLLSPELRARILKLEDQSPQPAGAGLNSRA